MSKSHCIGNVPSNDKPASILLFVCQLDDHKPYDFLEDDRKKQYPWYN